jgi:hypothetical protein
MKHLRLVLVLAACMVSAGSASASDIRLIFDPVPAQLGSLYLIQTPGTDYTVSWMSCNQLVIPPGLRGDNACLPFLNETGGPISFLDVAFTVNSALVGQTISCANTDGDLTTNNCAAYTPLTLGENVTVTFSGGTPVPYLMAFFVAENGVPLASAPTVGVTAVAEPLALPLLLMGLALMGLMLVGGKQEKIVAG